MRALPWTAAGILLCTIAGAPAARAAQNIGVTRKRIAADPAAEKLNRLLIEAQKNIDRKDYEAAVQNYQDYLAQKPGDAVAHFDLGYVYTALDRPSDAKGEYEKAISLDPKMGAAYLNLGLTLLASDPAAAVAPLQQAADILSGEARPRFLLATALDRSGKLDEAITQYRAAEKLDAKDFDTQMALAGALLQAKRPADAEAEFRSALTLQPNAPEAHLGLGESLLAEKKLNAAAEELGTYLQKNPGDARIHFERASILVDLGKYDEALAELDHAPAAGPESLPAFKLRAQIYFAEKQYAQAVPSLEKAAALAPQNVDIHALLGHALLAKKDYPNAVRELTAAYRLDPTASDVLGDLVLAEYNTRNYAAALAALDTLAQGKSLPPESWFIRAACYDHLGQPAPALDAYKKFLELNKDETSDMYFESASRVRALTRELQNRKR